ncbi:MAG: HNH endonuclease [Acidobacteria bacterium]|nr:HNH endonuclease [Acidobacteriota bacterium]
MLVPAGVWSGRKFCSRSCARATYNREHLRGRRNGRWRGGRAMGYGPRWKAIKEQVRARDRVCRSCGKTPERNGRALDVHHLVPFRFSGDNSLENLSALCRSCHMRADDHGRRGWAPLLRMEAPARSPSQREMRRRRGEAQRASRATLRAEARALSASGGSLREIAKVLGVSHQTISNWLGPVRPAPAAPSGGRPAPLFGFPPGGRPGHAGESPPRYEPRGAPARRCA